MKRGVLLCSYGSAQGVDDIPRYLRRIFGGPPPHPHIEGQLRKRYEALGGTTPLHATTERQAARLREVLGADWVVEVGMKNSPPFIADAARRLVEAGVGAGVVLPLAAHDSRKSVGGYLRAAREALAALPGAPPFGEVRGFARQPLLVAAWVERVRAGLAALPEHARSGAHVLFTAHSLPNGVVADGDPYPGEVAATARAVAEAAGLDAWSQCWQSASGPDWLGPDVLVAIDDLAKRGVQGLVVAPVGFVADHLETLYDLEVDAAARARGHGLAFARCPALNEDPRFIRLLAERVLAALPR